MKEDLGKHFIFCLGFHSILYHLYGDITITDEGLQILTYTRHSWPLSSEGSLTCHTYYDTGHHVFFFGFAYTLW